ncbi:helix-turn-helix domain-containing protein [Synechococcus sp. AH-601-B19]|nr:helix-turn-helix domain-containing protein [Synechococcus sp. AH-601-B19]
MKLELSYSDHIQLSESLNELGQTTRITQLEKGEGKYMISFKQSAGIALAEIQSTQPLLYEGWGTSWSVDFNWITPTCQLNDAFGYCEGYEMKKDSLGGFNTINTSPGNSWGKYSNSCSSTACMLDKKILMKMLKECNAAQAIENLSKARGLDINNESLHQLKKLTRKDLERGIINPTKYYDLIVACLESGDKRGYKKGLTKNYRLLGEIVQLSHESSQMSSPMTLSDVCQYLDTGQASLYRVCQDYFGMGIIEMMTQIRLEEARRSLLMLKQSENNHALTVRDIAISYGFKHQGRFSRRYFTSFGEMPSQTLDRSKEV